MSIRKSDNVLMLRALFIHILYHCKKKKGGLTLMNKAISWKVGGFAFLWKYVIFLKGSINFLVNSSQFSDIMYLRISLFRKFYIMESVIRHLKKKSGVLIIILSAEFQRSFFVLVQKPNYTTFNFFQNYHQILNSNLI